MDSFPGFLFLFLTHWIFSVYSSADRRVAPPAVSRDYIPAFWPLVDGFEWGMGPTSVEIPNGSALFKHVESHFCQTFEDQRDANGVNDNIARPVVMKIIAIGSTYLASRYAVKEQEITRRRGNENSFERYLWHGVPNLEVLESIKNSGFQLRRSDPSFGFFGHAIYFATDPRFAHCFTTANEDQERIMILSKACLGKIHGKRSILDPFVSVCVCVCVLVCVLCVLTRCLAVC